MRQSDIKKMLEHIDESLVSLEEQYTQSLRAKKLPDGLAIDVKNLMENLRSCLDYAAQDIYETIVAPHRTATGLNPVNRVYFPYGETKEKYDDSIVRNLPGLDSLNPAVYRILESVQPFSASTNWLIDLCSTVNDNKHNSLSAQERSERETYKVGLQGSSASISAPAGAIKAPPGAIRIGGRPVVFDPNNGVPLQAPGLDVKVNMWVDFKFAGTDISVLPLLKTAREAIGKTCDDIYVEMT
ncbi:MAG: hypothetical protein ACYC5F_00305 [Thermoleophilia bacterium]